MQDRSASLQRIGFAAALAAVCSLPSLHRARLAAALAAVCTIPVLLYLPFLTDPLQTDEGVYATVARLILDGDLPYRDAIDNKPPVVYGWYAISFTLFGEHVWAPRLLVSVLLSITTVLVYIQGRLLFSNREALIAAFGFATSIGVIRFETNANTEYFTLLPMVAGLLAFTLGMRTHVGWWFLGSGLLHGIAIMTKETSIFNLGFLMLWAAYPMWRNRAIDFKVLTSLFLTAAGCTVAMFAVVLPFILLGAGEEFFNTVVVYTLQYVGDTTAIERVGDAILMAPFPFAVACPWALLAIFAVSQTRRVYDDRWNWLLVGWLLASYTSILFVGRLYTHYYALLLPGMGLLAPLGVRYFQSRWQTSRALAALIMIPAVVVALMLNGPGYTEGSPAERHLAKFPDDPYANFRVQSPDLAGFITDNTSPDDKIYNLGLQGELYFYADRRSATRYIYDSPFAIDDNYLQEALTELNADKPVLIIDSASNDPYDDVDYDRQAVLDFINANYDHVGKVYYADVYRLRRSPSEGPPASAWGR